MLRSTATKPSSVNWAFTEFFLTLKGGLMAMYPLLPDEYSRIPRGCRANKIYWPSGKGWSFVGSWRRWQILYQTPLGLGATMYIFFFLPGRTVNSWARPPFFALINIFKVMSAPLVVIRRISVPREYPVSVALVGTGLKSLWYISVELLE